MKTRKHRFLALLLCLAMLIAALSATVFAENAGDGTVLSPDLEDIGDRIGPDQVGDWEKQDVPVCDLEKAETCEHSMKYALYTGRIFDPTCTTPGGIVLEWYCKECNAFMGESHLVMDGEAWQPRHVLESLKDLNGHPDCRKGYRCVVCGQEFINGTYSHKMVYEYVDELHHTGYCANPGCSYREENELHDYGGAVTAKNNKCVDCGYIVDGNGVTGKVTPSPLPTATPVRTPTPTPTAVPTATPHVHVWVYECPDDDREHHIVQCEDPDCEYHTPRTELHDFGDAVTARDQCLKCGVRVAPGEYTTPTPAPTKAPTPVPTAVPTPTPTLVPIDPNNTPVPATAKPAKTTAAPAKPAKTAKPTAVPEAPAKATVVPTATPKLTVTVLPTVEPVVEPASIVEAVAPVAAPAVAVEAPAAVPEVWKEVAEKLTFTEVKAVEVAGGAPVSDVIVRQAEIHDEYDAYMALTVEWKVEGAQTAGSVLHMSMPVEIEADTFKLVRVEEDGTLTEVEFTYEDGVLSFDAEDVALYLLVPVEE